MDHKIQQTFVIYTILKEIIFHGGKLKAKSWFKRSEKKFNE